MGTSVEGQPQIFYLPKEHNDKTMAKHEASLAAIEEEIKTAKANFEEDLLKIESKMSQNPDSLMRDEDLIHEDDEENEETENKPRSVITVAQPTKRPRQDSHRKIEQEKTEPVDKSMRITIKNDSKPTETKPNAGPTEAELPVPPASKKIKVEKGTGNGKNNQEKKTAII